MKSESAKRGFKYSLVGLIGFVLILISINTDNILRTFAGIFVWVFMAVVMIGLVFTIRGLKEIKKRKLEGMKYVIQSLIFFVVSIILFTIIFVSLSKFGPFF